MDVLLQDLRYAVRTLRKSPSFTLIAIVSLALGIGANTAIFTLADALLFRSLPIPEPERLVRVQSVDARGQDRLLAIMTPMVDVIRDAQVFDSVCGLLTPLATMEIDGRVRSVSGVVTSGDCFATLGVRPAIGRLLTREDDQNGAPKVAAVSYRSWMEDFGGRPDVLGRSIRLGTDRYTIVGVVERRFDGVLVGFPTRVYSSLHQMTIAGLSTASIGQVVLARLRSGDQMASVTARLAVQWPAWLAASVPARLTGTDRERYLTRSPVISSAATGLSEGLRTRFAQPLVALLVISGLVLLIASINVTNLLLVHAANRSRDLAVRLALGATRWRIARSVLAESGLVLFVAVWLGVLLAYACDRVLVATFRTTSQTFALTVTPDVRVFVFTGCAAAMAFLVITLGPVLQPRDFDISGLRGSSARLASTRNHTRRLVLVAQVALTLILVAVGSLFVNALASLQRAPLGVDPVGLLTVQLAPLPGGYPGGVAPPAYYRALLGRLAASPTIASVALSALDPLVNAPQTVDVGAANRDGISVPAEQDFVTETFFDTMRIAMVEGASFQPSDSPTTVILSESLAKRLFGSISAVGRVIRVGTTPELQALRVAGVARDAVLSHPQAHNTLVIYHNFWAEPEFFPTLVVRMRGDPSSVVATVRSALQQEGHEYPNRINTLSDARDASLAQERLLASLSAAYSVLGLMLAAVGLYGLLAFTVATRTSEIGLRMALGATRVTVVRLILHDAGLLLLAGIAVGVPLAWVASRAASRLLSGVPSTGGMSVAAAVLLMVGVAGMAAWLPTHRATAIDPMRALKQD